MNNCKVSARCANASYLFRCRFSLGLRGFVRLAGGRAMRQHDDLRIRPGRIRKGWSQRAKPFIAQALAVAERAGGILRQAYKPRRRWRSQSSRSRTRRPRTFDDGRADRRGPTANRRMGLHNMDSSGPLLASPTTSGPRSTFGQCRTLPSPVRKLRPACHRLLYWRGRTAHQCPCGEGMFGRAHRPAPGRG
jgi:hypothetical protein